MRIRSAPMKLVSGKILIHLAAATLLHMQSGSEESLPAATVSLEVAIQSALNHQTFLEIQREELNRTQGELLQTQGTFDWTAGGRVRHGFNRTPITDADLISFQQQYQIDTSNLGFDEYRTDTTEYTLGVGRQLRSGITTDLTVEFQQNEQRRIDLVPPVNRSRIVLGVTIPLLRGIGQGGPGATEEAAKMQVEATRLAVAHSASIVVVETTVAYWNTLAAMEALRLREESLARAIELSESIKRLVEADELPETTIGQAGANVSSQESLFVQARAQLKVAQHNLGLAMGLDRVSTQNIPLPEGRFPPPLSISADANSLASSIQKATKYRADYQQALLLEKGASLLSDQALNLLKPKLDLRIETDFAQVSEGSEYNSLLTPIRDRQAGPGFFAVVDLEFPFSNRAAKGRLLQARSSERQARLGTIQLEREINAGVSNRLNLLASNVVEISNNETTVQFYEQTLNDEERKFRMGMATLLDVVDTQERLNEALILLLDSKRRYAENLARLRFELGDLIQIEAEQVIFDSDTITTPPSDLRL
jgi:outer membrane protein